MFDELKAIENDQRKQEYTEDQISYFFVCDPIPMTRYDAGVLKELLIRHKVIGSEDHVGLKKVDDPATDLAPIFDEWRFSEPIRQRLLDVISGADAYYTVTADGSYESYGYLWSSCRVVQKGDEFALLDFFICD